MWIVFTEYSPHDVNCERWLAEKDVILAPQIKSKFRLAPSGALYVMIKAAAQTTYSFKFHLCQKSNSKSLIIQYQTKWKQLTQLTQQMKT